MREKYILRAQDGDKDSFVFGLVFTPPEPNKGPGEVMVGGPDRFQGDMLSAIKAVKSCCADRDTDRRIIRHGSKKSWENATKSRWVIKDVAVREWKAAVKLLKTSNMSVKKVTRFRSLMW
ncbi:MAG: hypothetical protein JRL30_01385 [Deltaproteobacteria bacterium]|nr:hypothetical protein [Deltaproteobacteria bacterium]